MSKIQTLHSDLLHETYYKISHDSGLPIYVFPKKLTSAYALFGVDFGSVDAFFDGEGKEKMPDGVAHFLEHKLFSNEDGSDSFEHFSAYGADANAFTSHTRTVYLFSATDRFSKSLSELLTFVTHPYFEKNSVEREKEIIGEEIRMCRDNPYDRCYYNMLAGLYSAHPVKNDICGSLSSIAKITPELLYQTYEHFYRLSNMALVVCGDTTPEEILKIADENLPPKCNYPRNISRFCPKEPPHAVKESVREAGQVAKPVFSIGFKIDRLPKDSFARSRMDAALALLSETLFSESGELYRRLIAKKLISPEFSSDLALTATFGFVQLAGEAEDPDAVWREVFAYLEEQQKQGIDGAEFERARRVEFAEYIKGFDSTEEIANNLLAFVFDGAEIFQYGDLLRGVRKDEIEELLAEIFRKENATLSVVFPKK